MEYKICIALKQEENSPAIIEKERIVGGAVIIIPEYLKIQELM
jgi:hypothetical protein